MTANSIILEVFLPNCFRTTPSRSVLELLLLCTAENVTLSLHITKQLVTVVKLYFRYPIGDLFEQKTREVIK